MTVWANKRRLLIKIVEIEDKIAKIGYPIAIKYWSPFE